MPSDAFIGVLTGLAGAHRERQKNIFDQEVDRRDKLAKAVEKLAEHPDLTPEGAEQLYKQAFGIRTFDVNKKLPKELENLATEVAPKFGQSWLGGQTTRDTTPQPMPIGADLEGGLSLNQIQGGTVPGVQDKVQAMRTPQATPTQAPMPQPPPGATRSIFRGPEEKFAEAMRLLNAQLQARQGVELETKRQELPIQVELARQQQRAQQEFAPAPAPKGFSSSPLGIYNQDTGELVNKADPTANLSFQEASYEDFKKRPDLTKKYGSDRLGYQAWRDAVELERQRAGAQNRFDIQDPARNFSQERQLAAQLLSETDMDRQRLQSYQNLQSVGNDLTGANQIVVLYNFIRLMDPNRVSEGELAIAQRAQTVPEEWKAIIGRFIGSPNIFSPEGAARLRAAADAMGKGIQKRVANVANRYKNIAESGGLNPENVMRGIPELLGPSAPPQGGLSFDGFNFPNQAALDEYKRRTGQQ
jgi:hypothetical protein